MLTMLILELCCRNVRSWLLDGRVGEVASRVGVDEQISAYSQDQTAKKIILSSGDPAV